jgi:HK97 family phage major capsid protein
LRSASALEHKAVFEAYVRSGEATGLRALEIKALSAGSNSDGGYLVPPEVETQIGRRLTAISAIRSMAGVRAISSNVYKKPFMTAGPAVGWVGETDARTQTTSPTLDELSFPAMELYAMPAATATLLEDAAVNIDQWLAQDVEQVFAAQEGTAFVTGDGSNRPKGSSNTPRWPTRRGAGAISGISPRARPAPSRRPIRPTCWSIWFMR